LLLVVVVLAAAAAGRVMVVAVWTPCARGIFSSICFNPIKVHYFDWPKSIDFFLFFFA
jgi:hypothetical protein